MRAETARTWKRWGRHPTAGFLALAFAVLAAYNGYLHLTGPSRMTDRLRARLAEGPATVNVLVTAKFPPEEFHIRLLQQVGNMRGVEGSTAKLSTPSLPPTSAMSPVTTESTGSTSLRTTSRSNRSAPPGPSEVGGGEALVAGATGAGTKKTRDG